jgi:hypothetical protein
MQTTLLQSARVALATVVTVSVPAYASWSLACGAAIDLARGEASSHSADLRIADLPEARAHAPRSASVDSGGETLVDNWVFTSKGNGSPYR